MYSAAQERDGLVDQLAIQAEAEGDLARLVLRQADRGLDVLLENELGVLGGDLLDFHAARLRRHHQQLGLLAIEQHAQVELALDGQTFLDQQAAHHAPFRPRLVGDQRHAEHLPCQLAGLFHRLGDLDAAALAAAAGVDLRLHHHHLRAVVHQPARDALGFLDGGGHLAARHRDAILRQNCFCLVLVNFHGRNPLYIECMKPTRNL